MAISLNVQPEEVIKNGGRITELSGDFKAQLDNVKTANENLKSGWAGQVSQSYSTKVSEQITQLEQLYSALAEIGENITNIGTAYKNVRENYTQK
ncbi:MAG: WXG100 family type VII secretion target [Bacilli bacterium]|nr:WXG100 family type VII secretion target [Bacilli bacterium]